MIQILFPESSDDIDDSPLIKNSNESIINLISYSGLEEYTKNCSAFNDIWDNVASKMRTNIEWKKLFDKEISDSEDALNMARMMVEHVGFFNIGIKEFVEMCLKKKYRAPLTHLFKHHAFEEIIWYDIEHKAIGRIVNKVEKFLKLEKGSIQI
jgi:hypothetical protein